MLLGESRIGIKLLKRLRRSGRGPEKSSNHLTDAILD